MTKKKTPPVHRMRTYMVRDMLEWHTYVKAGKLKIPIRFEGGCLTPYGLVGGRFSTDQPAIQHLIESSPEFRKGRILVLTAP